MARQLDVLPQSLGADDPGEDSMQIAGQVSVPINKQRGFRPIDWCNYGVILHQIGPIEGQRCRDRVFHLPARTPSGSIER